MTESIGAALRAAREMRRLTLAQVSESTRIRGHYLQALESDDLSAIPSTAQARGFLKIYAQFLGLDLESLLLPSNAAAPQAPTADQAPGPQAAGLASAPAAQRPGLLTDLRHQLTSLFSRHRREQPASEAPAAAGAEPPIETVPDSDEADTNSAGKKKVTR